MRSSQRRRCRILVGAVCMFGLIFASTCLSSGSVASAASIQEPNLAGKVIVIDPGHGGPDSGARNELGHREKEITLAVAFKLAHFLRQAGATVHLTRVTDDDLATEEDQALNRRQNRDLRNRTRFTVARNPDAFVSVHCNAAPSSAWFGAQTFYMTGNPHGEELAKRMQGAFKAMLLPTHREADDIGTLYLLRRIDGPAVLAEIGFLSNEREALAMKTDAYQQTIAFAMYVALMDYFSDESLQTAQAK